MPHATTDTIQIRALPDALRKDSEIGAEVVLPESKRFFDPAKLSSDEVELLRAGLFSNGGLVIRNQSGLNPTVMVQLAKLFDPTVKDIHSGGEKQVTDPKNILSQNGCSRVPRAPQVTVIGQGVVEGHEGIPTLDLKHLVSNLWLSDTARKYPLTRSQSRTILHSMKIR
jgi:xanthine dioxygenase